MTHNCKSCEKQFFLSLKNDQDSEQELNTSAASEEPTARGIKRKAEESSAEENNNHEQKIQDLEEKLVERNTKLNIQMDQQNKLMDLMDIPQSERNFFALQDAIKNLKSYFGESMWSIISFKQKARAEH